MFFWNSCFFHDPADVGNLISGSSAFSKTSEHQEVHGSRIAEAWLGEFEHYFTNTLPPQWEHLIYLLCDPSLHRASDLYLTHLSPSLLSN